MENLRIRRQKVLRSKKRRRGKRGTIVYHKGNLSPLMYRGGGKGRVGVRSRINHHIGGKEKERSKSGGKDF